MHYRVLGRTGLKVSLLSLGTGGPSRLGQGTNLSPKEQDAIVRRAIDLGINLIDTAERYGESQAILGRALKGVPRDTYLLASKWNHDDDGECEKDPSELMASVDRGLRLLRTDRIDIMQFQGVVPSCYNRVVERYYPVMQRLGQQGKVRFIGLSERFREDPKHEVAMMALSTDPDLWDTVMLKYGVLNQYAAVEALPLALEHGVGVLNMAAVRVRLPRPDRLRELIAEWKARGVVPPDSLPDNEPLGWLVHDDVDSVVSAGYKFAADHPAVSTVLTGTADPAHLESNAAALERPFLPRPDKERLVKLFAGISEYV